MSKGLSRHSHSRENDQRALDERYRTAPVISAHSADFVWRCGGTIATHQEKGYDVSVVCLAYGEHGESAKLWKQEGMTLDKIKASRRTEAENAAKVLDAHEILFFDLGETSGGRIAIE